MKQVDHLERLLQGVHSATDDAVVAAAKELLQLGEVGSPAGAYCLLGGKAALRLGCLADAVVLLFHGIRMAEPNTKLWAELLVNRAVACARHGLCRDAIAAGEQLFSLADSLPEMVVFMSYVHHSVGFAYDRMNDYHKAANHYRLAVETYQDPTQQAVAMSDLAYALVRSNNVDAADPILNSVDPNGDTFATFVLACTTALVRYHQQRFADALAAAERAEALAIGHEKTWADPLAELWYWESRIVWELGDRYRAAALALNAAVTGDQIWNHDLRNRASDWLAEMMDKGGIQ